MNSRGGGENASLSDSCYIIKPFSFTCSYSCVTLTCSVRTDNCSLLMVFRTHPLNCIGFYVVLGQMPFLGLERPSTSACHIPNVVPS